MCGICGGVFGASDGSGQRFIETCGNELAARGPDGAGRSTTRIGPWTVRLGHRRLSIIDPTPGGHQPMWRGDRLALNYNGEVYNHIELRAMLVAAGHRFTGQSDTEVVLAAYEEWGERCVDRMRGMFAFALLDVERQVLLLVRDRFGIKPLYWTASSNQLLFASLARPIARAVCALPNIPFVTRGLRTLAFEDDSEATQYVGVSSVRPGHIYTVDLGQPSPVVSHRRYYDLGERVQAAGPIEIGTRDAITECRRRLDEVVDLRLRADVPVAATLSGGVDSSVLAALARRRCGPIVAYCFGHPDVRSTEASVAAGTGRFASIEARWVYPTARVMAEAFWATLDAQDSPFSTLGIAGQYAVYDAARRDGQKVLVGGQGGDEVFLGYRKALLWTVTESLAGGEWWGASRAAANTVRAGVAEWRHLPLFARHVAARRRWPRSPVVGWPESATSAPRGANAMTVAERQVSDIERGGLPTLLRYEDRNSMANSIESRVPFLDHLLVEWAVRLPTRLKLRDGYGKWILRQAAKGLVPPAVLDPRAKRGFDVDGAAWMRAGLGAQIRAELTRVSPRLQDAGIRVRRSGAAFSDRALARPGGALASVIAAIWVGRTLE